MEITIKFSCDNECFEHDRYAEIARVLRSLASKLADHRAPVGDVIFDLNGNPIGYYDYSIKD